MDYDCRELHHSPAIRSLKTVFHNSVLRLLPGEWQKLFRPPKGPGTKKYPTKDKVRIRVKKKILSQGK